MANIDLNVSPYFDDFNPETDYLRVLFRPGFPVQARELTTLQTFMQEQVSRFGNHIFKDGSRVTNGEIQLDTDAHRLSLTGISNLRFPAASAPTGATLGTTGELDGLVIQNPAGTVKARVRTQPTGSSTTVSSTGGSVTGGGSGVSFLGPQAKTSIRANHIRHPFQITAKTSLS